MVEEQTGQLPVEVDGDGLRRRNRVNTEVVENVPLTNLRKKEKIFKNGK